MAKWLSEHERDGEHAHQWVDDRCVDCGLVRQEVWSLDGQGSAVITLVWSSPSGRVLRIRPFPVLLGVSPPSLPTQTADEMFPQVRTGREPKCPHQLVDWDA